MNLPIQITEQEINEDWKPELGKQYIIEYQWKKGDSNWIIGQFFDVWFGYTFHWFWGASSLQLGIKGKSILKYPEDWKNFKRVYLFEPHPEPDFIKKGEVEI